jgi:hypothetical protein
MDACDGEMLDALIYVEPRWVDILGWEWGKYLPIAHCFLHISLQ